MIDKKEIYDFIIKSKKPVKSEEIYAKFMENAKDDKLIKKALNEYVKSGMIYHTSTDRYALPEKMGLVFGTLMTNEKGFGFVKDDSENGDIFIPHNFLYGAMNGDNVFVKIEKNSKNNQKLKREGIIKKVVTRYNSTIVGTLQKSRNMGFVIPDDTKIFTDVYIPKKYLDGTKDGQKVVAEITKWPEKNRNPEGKIKEVLGSIDEKGVDILSIIRKYKLPESFNKKVHKEAELIPEKIIEKDIKNRKDFRNKNIITIDGIDAKDLDDAVYLEKNANGDFVLSVHIADVSHYVKQNSKIDKEALKRGTSVYLVDRVIPMLPEKLSNGICSLNEGVDRFTLSIEMTIDKNGKVLNYNVFEGVINSKKRLNYKEVNGLFEKDKIDANVNIKTDIQEMLFEMKTLSEILNKKRVKRGSINFDFPETSIKLDENGKVAEITERTRGVSNKLIEEFMLIANETIAEYMYWLEIPFVYRVHETPDLERINDLNKFIAAFGKKIKIKNQKIEPSELQDLINEIDGEPYERLVNKLMLRSLKQARYAPQCLGHFGLAAKYYCHFTSPIRRYPDLEIHRIIKEHLHSKTREINVLTREVELISERSSTTERIAETVERETDNLKMCEFMLDKIGEEFTGVISYVTKNGIYTELENTIEGFTKVSRLGSDYYEYVENNLSFVGQYTKDIFTIGDIVRIRVESVDMMKRKIDFDLIEKTGKKERDKRTD